MVKLALRKKPKIKTDDVNRNEYDNDCLIFHCKLCKDKPKFMQSSNLAQATRLKG